MDRMQEAARRKAQDDDETSDDDSSGQSDGEGNGLTVAKIQARARKREKMLMKNGESLEQSEVIQKKFNFFLPTPVVCSVAKI